MLLPSILGEDLFDEFFNDFKRPMRSAVRYNTPTTSVMKTDVRESEGGYELDIDLPGYKKENLKLELKEGYLTVHAEQKNKNDEKDENGKYIRRERYYGSCSRSFYVGDQVTQEDIKARFEEGILTVSVPKKDPEPVIEESKYIQIEG